MKKLHSLLAMAAMAMAMTFAACSDDDGDVNPEDVTTMADKVVGIYDSEITVTMSGIDLGTSQYDIKIEKNSDTQINFILEDFSITGIGNIGTIQIDGVEIAEVDGNYAFDTTGSLESFSNLPYSLTGSFTDTTIDAIIELQDMDITVTINGTKTSSSTSDSDDIATDESGDGEAALQTAAEMMAGNYTCEINVTVNDIALEPSTNNVSIIANDDNTVNFVLQDFSISSDGVTITPTNPDGEAIIELVNVEPTETDGVVSFTTDQELTLVLYGLELPVNVSANGTVSDGTLETTLTINLTELGMDIDVTINGEKVEE